MIFVDDTAVASSPRAKPRGKGLTPRKHAPNQIDTPRAGKAGAKNLADSKAFEEAAGIFDSVEREEPAPAEQPAAVEPQREIDVPMDQAPQPVATEAPEEAALHNSSCDEAAASEGDVVAQMHGIVVELQRGISERDEKIAEQEAALDNASEDTVELCARHALPAPSRRACQRPRAPSRR